MQTPFAEHQGVAIITNTEKFSNYQLKYTSLHPDYIVCAKLQIKYNQKKFITAIGF
jgi:hypothetical protein